MPRMSVTNAVFGGLMVADCSQYFQLRYNDPRWRYGPKRTFATLVPLLPEKGKLIDERAMGALFQFRFVSYLFERYGLIRRVYHAAFLLFSILLWPMNRLPGAILVTTMEKE